MIVNCLEITETLKLESLAPERLAAAAREANRKTWLDLQGATPEELEEWLDELGIEGLARRLCLEARGRAGYYPLKREILLVIPVPVEAADSDVVENVVLLCREDQLLTLHESTVFDPKRLATLEAADSWLSERSIAGLVSALMIDQSLDALRRTAILRDSVLDLEERMERDPDSVEVEEILERRSQLVALGVLVGDQLPSVEALSLTDRPFFSPREAREYIQCALANLRTTDAQLTWLDQRVGALHSGFQMHAQDKTNHRLGMLTILSAIFMPITLLAGIWGMNFESMPELKLAYAYPLALGFMALVGLLMYRFFRRTGWFD